MARTAAGATLTRTHQRQQLALRAATLRDLLALWPLFDPGEAGTFDEFLRVATTLVRARHRDSSGLASRYYRLFRGAEGIAGEVLPQLAAAPPVEEVTVSLRATGLTGTLRALRAGRSLPAARRTGFVQVSGSAGRLVLNGGRDTIVGSVQADPVALGWARVTDADPCAFCAMLAGRGPVFTAQSATRVVGRRGGPRGARQLGQSFHDHDACTTEPVYEDSQWPGSSREYQRLWSASTGGKSGKDAINAFRRAYEGRGQPDDPINTASATPQE